MNYKKKVYWIVNIAFTLYILIIIYPQFLYSEKLEYKNFKVYYHNKDINKLALIKILDISSELISKSTLSENGYKQKLFLCGGYNEFFFFSPLYNKAFAVNYPLIQNIFITKSFVVENQIIRNSTEFNTRTLSGVIAHETTHSLLENEMNLIDYKLIPSWKNEGYCDYIAKESSFNELKGNQLLCENLDDSSNSFKYFKYAKYVNYLFEYEKISMDSFLNTQFEMPKIDVKWKQENCKKEKLRLLKTNSSCI